jgi:hypothetical protein
MTSAMADDNFFVANNNSRKKRRRMEGEFGMVRMVYGRKYDLG